MAGKRSAARRGLDMEVIHDRAVSLSSFANRKASVADEARRLIDAANHLRTNGAEIWFGMPHELHLVRSNAADGVIFDTLADNLLEAASFKLEVEGA